MSKKETLLNFSINSFYGKHKNNKRSREWERRLEEAEKKLKAKPVIKPYKSRLHGPCILWKTFFRQNEAFEFAHQSSEDLEVFAFESSTLSEPGKRMYLVASYHQFWHYYSQLQPDQRHHYEIIPENAVCKLYFDLEFNKEINKHADGAGMTRLFIRFVIEKLEQKLNVSCSEDDVLQLDSSSNNKFSQHLIFNIDNVAFKDNTHAGTFVKHVLSELWAAIRCGDNEGTTCSCHTNTCETVTNETLMDKNVANVSMAPTKENASFTDKGLNPGARVDMELNNVSTGNGDDVQAPSSEDSCDDSTKCGDSLELSPYFSPSRDVHSVAMVTPSSHGLCPCTTCLQCLKKLVIKDNDDNETLFCDTGVYTKNRNFRLFMSTKIGKNRPLVLANENRFLPKNTYAAANIHLMFMVSLISNIKYTENLRILSYGDDQKSTEPAADQHINRKDRKSQEHCGNSQSPYPEIDKFVRDKVINKGGVDGHIRRWTYFSDGETLLYDIVGNRWCENIGRAHKSNNIMIVVSVKEGVFYQKCHDPVCRRDNYKSPNYPLPKEILPQWMCLDDNDFNEYNPDDISDLDLVEAVTSLETGMVDVSDGDLMEAVDLIESTTENNSPKLLSHYTTNSDKKSAVFDKSGDFCTKDKSENTMAHSFNCSFKKKGNVRGFDSRNGESMKCNQSRRNPSTTHLDCRPTCNQTREQYVHYWPKTVAECDRDNRSSINSMIDVRGSVTVALSEVDDHMSDRQLIEAVNQTERISAIRCHELTSDLSDDELMTIAQDIEISFALDGTSEFSDS